MFLPKVLEQTDEAESPRQFFFWAALTAVSAVLKRNVNFNRYFFRVYPNIYVILIARSGLRKGLPVDVATKLVTAVNNTRVIEGRSSIQGLIKELANAWIPEGKDQPVNDACGYLVSPELSAAMVEDPAALTIMTDLYDSQAHNKWKNRLKGTGLEVLEHPTITWLGASNPELLKTMITVRELHGGFIGRTFLITADKKNRLNSLVDEPGKYINYDDLTQELLQISRLNGEFKFADEKAKREFDLWYRTVGSEESEDTTGTYDRLDTHVLKVAMLVQAGRHCNLEITKETLQEAIELCAPMVRSADTASQGRGQNVLGPVLLKVIQELYSVEGWLERSKILRKLWKDITADDLNKIIDTLEQAGTIKTGIEDGIVVYKLTDDTRRTIMERSR